METTRKSDWYYHKSFRIGETVELDDEESRHVKVKRNRSGEEVCVFDGKGNIGIGSMIPGKRRNSVQIAQAGNLPEDTTLTIACATPKGKRMDFLVQKLTELGTYRFIPTKTIFTVVEPGLGKKNRWDKIIIEACKQSKRAHIMHVEDMTPFSQVISQAETFDNRFILLPDGEDISKIDVSGKILMMIGPEGGFSEKEIEDATQHGFRKVAINKNILRIETAAIAAAAIVKSRS